MPEPDLFVIRVVTVADAPIVAHHRVAMCLDIGTATPAVAEQLRTVSQAWLASAIARGEYVGWLAASSEAPASVVAGAGVQLRRVLPFPRRFPEGRADVAEGRAAIVVNVYTEPPFRRRGLARRLMETVLAWAAAQRLESLVLHAAPDGRPLYESLGFAVTNEMRFMGDLAQWPAVPKVDGVR